MTLSASSGRVDLVAVGRPRLGNNSLEKQRGCPTRRVYAWEGSTLPSKSIPSLIPSDVVRVKSPSLQKRRLGHPKLQNHSKPGPPAESGKGRSLGIIYVRCSTYLAVLESAEMSDELNTPKPEESKQNTNNGAEKRWIVRFFAESSAADWAIVLLTAAIVVVGYWQWQAISGQLEEMKKGSTDTHELAVQAKNQADRTKDIADRALAQATATNKLAQEAKRSADATFVANKIAVEAMRQSQRPWIGPDIKMPVATGPLTIDQRGMIMTNYQMTAINYGNYGANNINFWAQLYIAQDITTIWARAKYACDVSTQNPNLGRIMFPGQERIMSNAWPAMAMDVIRNNKANPPYNEFQAYLLTCIGYRDQFHLPHHTGTIFRYAQANGGESVMFALTPNSSISGQWIEWYSFLD
jgi:hypothetical protein